MTKNFALVAGAFGVSAATYFMLSLTGVSYPISMTAAITLFTAVLWVMEPLPLPATSLIPFFAFPMTGILTHKEAAASLGSHVIILLMGAFMLSKAVERSEVHKRLAIYMLSLTGRDSARGLVLGFMLTAAVLSMWISNTATALMLLPIALAIIPFIESQRLIMALLLGIAYASSLGGVGTPIGTPPNIIFMSVYSETQGTELDFLTWMKTGVPIVLISIPFMALWLTRGLGRLGNIQLPTVGTWATQEKRVLIVFGLIVAAWILRPFWTGWLDLTTVGDSSIALAGVVAMFLVPSGRKNDQGERLKDDRLLDWQTASDIPWGMLLLFAGGICIAKAFTASGLSDQLASVLTGLSDLPLVLLILLICLFVTFLTEITSNTATATLLMPILASAGAATGIDPIYLMMPAAIAASCAFMLPVATAPNAIIYGSGKVSIKGMVREGFVLNIITASVIALVSYFTLA